MPDAESEHPARTIGQSGTIPEQVAATTERPARPLLSWISVIAAGLLLVLLAFSAASEGLALHGIGGLPQPPRSVPAGPSDLALSAVGMAAPDDGWAFASYFVQPTPTADGNYGSPPTQHTALLHYDGSAWRVFQVAPLPYVNSISMVSRDEGWAAGSGGFVQYHAGRWSGLIQPAAPGSNPTPGSPYFAPQFHSVAMATADEGWAGGENVFFHYHGGVWTPVTLPLKAAQYTIFTISMRGADEGWAVGEQFDAQYTRSILALHYTGGRWIETDPGMTGSLYGVACAGPGEAWGTGAADPGLGPGLILHFSNGRWTRAKSPTPNILTRVTMVSPSEGWAIGDGAATLHYNAGTWTREGSVIHGVRLNDLALASSGEGWAVGTNVSGGGAVLLHYTHGAWAPYPLDGIAAQLLAQTV